MKRTALLLLALLAFAPSHAQRRYYNDDQPRIRGLVSLGGVVSQIEGDELKGFRQLGFTGGVGAMVRLDRQSQWQLGVEIKFSQRGAWQKNPDPYAMNLYLNYVDIPILLHWTDPIGGITVGLGLEYGRRVNEPHSTLYYNPDYFYPDTSDFSFLKNDLAAVVDVRFALWRNLYIDLRWQHSIIPIKRDWTFYEYKKGYLYTHSNNAYNHALSLRLIWQF